MPSQTNEQALEAAIQKKLTGTSLEELKAQGIAGASTENAARYRASNGYWLGEPKDFDLELALDKVRFWHFLESTQPEELAKLKAQLQWQLRVLQRLIDPVLHLAPGIER